VAAVAVGVEASVVLMGNSDPSREVTPKRQGMHRSSCAVHIGTYLVRTNPFSRHLSLEVI